MIALTVDGAQLDAYQNILLRNIAIPRDFDNLHVTWKSFEICFPKILPENIITLRAQLQDISVLSILPQ